MIINLMEHIINVLGLLGSIGVGLSLIPQTYKSINSNEKSLSLPFIIITFISSTFMIIYSSYYVIIPMLIANFSVFINITILLILYIKRNN